MSAAVMPLSARGVAGEAVMGASSLLETLRTHGGHVPNYNIQGFQHHSFPHKDKKAFFDVQPRADWTNAPRHKTKTDMQTARRAAKHPDISYDIDGDGAVGPTDYFIAKQFSHEQDHRLNTAERGNLVKALESGVLDKYSFGHEQAGAKRPFPVMQKRGKIITVDNMDDLRDAYPPHWNAHKVPQHRATTDLNLHRTAHLSNQANTLKDTWDKLNPQFVPEPPVMQEFMVADPQFSSVSHRRETFRATARADAGMSDVNTSMNPERERMDPGLGYRRQPEHPTRTALNEKRREQLREDLTQTRALAEQDYVPIGARHTAYEHEEYNRRRPDPSAMTLTKLKNQRKQEYTEYNMTNFQAEQKEVARYSARAEPWWTLQSDHCPDPPPCKIKEQSFAVSGKVTEHNPFPQRTRELTPRGNHGSVPEDVPTVQSEVGQKTFKRWTSEFAPQGLSSQAPRLFDGVKQAQTLKTDTAPLHHLSSFDPIRGMASGEGTNRQQRQARDDDERCRMWRLYARGGPSLMAKEGSLGIGTIAQQASPSGSSREVPGAVGSPTTTRNLDPAWKMPPGVPSLGPSGCDPAMNERLDRSVGYRPEAIAEEPMEARPHIPLTVRGGPSTLSHRSGHSAPPVRTSPYGGSTEPVPSATHGAAQAAAAAAAARRQGANSSASVSSVVPTGGSMVVRSSGFQWLNGQVLQEEMSVAQSLYSLPDVPSKTLSQEPPSKVRRESNPALSRMGSSVA